MSGKRNNQQGQRGNKTRICEDIKTESVEERGTAAVVVFVVFLPSFRVALTGAGDPRIQRGVDDERGDLLSVEGGLRGIDRVRVRCDRWGSAVSARGFVRFLSFV